MCDDGIVRGGGDGLDDGAYLSIIASVMQLLIKLNDMQGWSMDCEIRWDRCRWRGWRLLWGGGGGCRVLVTVINW